MRTYLLIALLFTVSACTPSQEQTALSVVDGIAVTANTAGAAGVPFGGAVGSLLLMAGAGYKAWRKLGTEKDKNNANYRAINDSIEATQALAAMLKSGEIDASEAAKILETLVSSTVQTVHSANGVYQAIRADLKKLRSKGENL